MKNYQRQCGYSIGRLKPHLYLIPRDKNDITVNLSTLTFTLNSICEKLNVHQIEFNHNQSNFSKFQFVTNLSIILGESKENLDVIDEMRNNDYIIIVEDYYNKKYLLNIDFKYKIEYEHIFDDEMNYSEINITTTSNYPVLQTNEQIRYSDLNDEKESYLNGGIKKLKLINRDKVVIDEDGKMTYNQEDLFAIEFISANANIGYNGSYYTNNIAFQIGCDNHYAYHLIEHPNNSYTGIIETNNGLFYIIGDNGMIGTYTMTIEDDFNSISISLNGYSNNNMISTKESTPYTTEWKYYTDLCDGYNLYEYESLQYTEDGINWNNVQPLQTRKGKLIEENSLQCISSDDDDDDEDVKVITATYQTQNGLCSIINTSFTSLPNYEVGMSNSPIKYSYIKIDGEIATLMNNGMYYFGDSNEHVVEFYGVDEISDYAFYRCYSMTKVEFSSKIKEIGFGAFYDCTTLNEIKFNDIRKINSFAFYNCNLSQNLIFEKNIEYIGENAFAFNTLNTDFDKLENIVIPKGANCVIDKNSFKGRLHLVEANLEGVTRINNYSFEGCGRLTSVVFGDKLEYIGREVFDIYGMKTLTFNSPTPPTVEYNWYYGTPTEGTVYVPSEYYGSTWGTWVTNNLEGWTLRTLD